MSAAIWLGWGIGHDAIQSIGQGRDRQLVFAAGESQCEKRFNSGATGLRLEKPAQATPGQASDCYDRTGGDAALAGLGA
ncbi:MAG: hypothetical protein CMJ48_13155 [Planctomycetaceae bacterium]|nr:hypothetical protein [Planctomycetaceae bacterium]